MSDEENQKDEPQGVDSGIEGVSADDTYQNTPVFDVNDKDFYNNMKVDRNRIRINSNSNVSKFMQQSNYRKPFYMRHTDNKGQQYLKKVK